MGPLEGTPTSQVPAVTDQSVQFPSSQSSFQRMVWASAGKEIEHKRKQKTATMGSSVPLFRNSDDVISFMGVSYYV